MAADPLDRLVRHLLETPADAVPEPVIAHSRDLTQDTIACIYAGSTAAGIDAMLELASLWGGTPQATILGHSRRTSVPFAAQLNAAMGHARDYDDTHDEAVHHGCVTLVPALLAVAELLETAVDSPPWLPVRPIGGREWLAALGLGLDVANRFGLAFVPWLHTGWLPTTLWGPLSCAGAISRLLRLDHQQTRHALGLAYAQVHGNRQALIDGALAKRLQPGFSAFAGVQAAFLAARGISAGHDIVSGDYGLAALYTQGQVDLDCLTRDLGQSWETLRVSLKPYPSCRCTHPVIDAALALRQGEALDPAEIVSGHIALPPVSMGQIGQPFQLRDNPTVDAQFSAQFTAALALLEGRPRLDHFTAQAVRQASLVQALAARLTTSVHCPDTRGLVPIDLSLTLRDGRTLTHRIEEPLGSPANPLSADAARFKFRDCLGLARSPWSEAEQDHLLRVLSILPELASLAPLRELLR